MNNRHRIPERVGYAIKVNKKELNNNNIQKINNCYINSNNNNFN